MLHSARRFQVVIVNEPDEPVAVEMMRGLVGTLGRSPSRSHHERSRRRGRQVIQAIHFGASTAGQIRQLARHRLCARIQLSQSSTPPPIEDAHAGDVISWKSRIRILNREQQTGADHSAKKSPRPNKQKREVEQELEESNGRSGTRRKLFSKRSSICAKKSRQGRAGTFERSQGGRREVRHRRFKRVAKRRVTSPSKNPSPATARQPRISHPPTKPKRNRAKKKLAQWK